MARADQVWFLNEQRERSLGFARAVRSGIHLYVSGCTSLGADGRVAGVGDMTAQIRAVYQQLATVLKGHRLGFEHVIKEVLFTTDMPAFLAAAPVRAAFYAQVAPPAASGVEVSGLVHPEMLVEIELIAEFPQQLT